MRSLFSKTVALLLCAACVFSASAQSSTDTIEQTFWQSTERIGTPDAYRAYLGRYPSGLFAPLAEAALGKVKPADRGPADAASQPGRSQATARRTTLNSFSEAPNSGAVTLQLGDEIVGPKAVTVGWLGARKQLIVPAGHWIALAAEDEKAYPTTAGVLITTVVFGRFEGGRLAAMTRYTFNAKVVPNVNWGRLEGCAAGSRHTFRSYTPSTSGVRTECARLGFDPAPLRDASPVTARVSASLAALGGTVRGPALVSSLSYSQNHHGLLRVARYDWPGAVLGDAGQTALNWRPDALDASKEAYVNRLWTWFESYRTWATDGYLRDIDEGHETFTDFNPGPP